MIYVMSDIHGNRRRFDSVMEQINLQPEDTLYVLGDVIDRFPDGLSILRQLMGMPNVKMTLGNHEYMMLRALGKPYDTYEKMSRVQINDAMECWIINRGAETYQSWKRLSRQEQREIIQHLQSLPLNYDLEINGSHYTLAHAAPPQEFEYFRRGYPGPTFFATWKPWRNHDDQHGDYITIHGHISTDYYQTNDPLEIFTLPDRTAIDCGSGFPESHGFNGRLACLRLDDMKSFYSIERGY